jgi:acetolactate synthase-1/2/3 large subunit
MTLKNTDNLPVLVRKAFDTAVQERPGPVFMELPEDLMGQETSARPQPGHPPECVRPDRSSFHQLAETLREAEAPMVIAGQGVIRGRASEALIKFAHAWNIPVVHTWMASGAVPSDDSCSMNTIGARTNDRLRIMYEKADLVIIAGAELSEFPPAFWNIGRHKEAIYFGQVPLDHFENFVPEVQVIGSLRYSLDAMAEIGRTRPAWHEQIRSQVLAQLAEPAIDGKEGVHPKNIVLALRRALGKTDILTSDVGAHLMWLAQFYPSYRENTLLIPYGLFPMGIGLPTAMAAKMVNPMKKVVAAVGDGSLMMTVAELETAKRLGLGIAVVVFDDQGLGLIKDKMQKHLGRQSGMDFGPTDYVKLAEAFGAEGHEVKTVEAFSSTLTDVLTRDALAIISVKVDYCHNHCVIP